GSGKGDDLHVRDIGAVDARVEPQRAIEPFALDAGLEAGGALRLELEVRVVVGGRVEAAALEAAGAGEIGEEVLRPLILQPELRREVLFVARVVFAERG